tara:strand:- start:12791 stop:13162 length:372 start_codon:yes stop_codon:yes gene_type:complete
MRYTVSLLLFIFLISCYNPERKCENFRTGTFEFEAIVGSEILKTTFVRNDSIEIDYFRGKADTSSIRWINDCEYILKKLNPRSMADEKSIHMKILTTDKDTYTFEYNIVGQNNKERGTARRIN